MRVLAAAVTVVGALVLLVGLAGLAARQVDSPRQSVILAATLTPMLALGSAVIALALVALAIRTGQRWTAAVGVLVIVLTVALALPAVRTVLHRAPTVAASGLTVLSINLREGRADPTAVLALATGTHAELMSLQELTPAALDGLDRAGLAAAFPYRYAEPGSRGSGIGLFSRRPLTHHVYHAGFVNKVISAEVESPTGRVVTVLASHLSAPWPQSPVSWRSEIHRLAVVLKSIPTPVIDAGDFNATTSSKAFRNLLSAGDVVDGATQAATFVRTYPADARILPPLLGIDHVLTRDAPTSSIRTHHIPGTDHRALVARLAWPS